MADAVEQLRNIHGLDIPAHIDYPNGVPEETEAETEAEAEGEETYEDVTVTDLKEEIARRNVGRDDDDKIVVEAPGNKPELIAALEADDASDEE